MALLSTDPIYSNYYSITGLYERLRADAVRYPDTMDQRYGAWAQLLALFRLMYFGGSHGAMKIPAREGYLFDPDRYLFLEGRQDRQDKASIPHVPDGVAYRVLSKLLLLDGERLSYRTLAVEQIGSVYEAIMGFELQVAAGKSIAIKPTKKHGAPSTVNLEGLLRTAGDKRLKWFVETTDQKLTGQAAEGVKSAVSIEELLVALDRKIAKAVTPNVVPPGAMIFQPSNERRRSGSHYTPSSLTGPIVEAALAPVLKQLGDNPKPHQILNLKICDPAMGSGAFLVQACRQLGDELTKAWHAHNDLPVLPPDEEEALHAQRIVAQRCLYGVDKNPMAVDLAKLSLWLATLAKDHPFTFLDHSLRHGDSLVGLTRQQIAAFHWVPAKQQSILEQAIRKRIDRVSQFRRQILEARDDVPYATLKQKLDGADESLVLPRRVGDAVISAFFSADKPRRRDTARLALQQQVELTLKDVTDDVAEKFVEDSVANLLRGPKGIKPFHWELEFPEVFTMAENGQSNGGFDVIVGNPPFAGKNTIAAAHAGQYLEWLQTLHLMSHGNSDLVAHFFRRAFELLRPTGCFGLIATNTIAQGDTRSTGLRWICENGGNIYRARKRLKWPGQAAVTVSVVHVSRHSFDGRIDLDGKTVDRITAYLFHSGDSSDPARLKQNVDLAFKGCEIGSLGYLLNPDDPEFSLFNRINDPRNPQQLLLKPYLGGQDLNEGIIARFVLDVDGLSSEQMDSLPEVKAFLEQRVRADFIARGEVRPDTKEWWHFRRPSLALRQTMESLSRFIVISRVSEYAAFTFTTGDSITNSDVIGFRYDDFSMFGLLQSRVHEIWARFFASSLEDRLRYTPSDSFETFPIASALPSRVEDVAKTYFETRSRLLQDLHLGLTEIYNCFNDPGSDCPEIDSLRRQHDLLDVAVLEAYGWTEISLRSDFIVEFPQEDEEDENGRPRRKKYRYRWPDEIRDEVLARLLQLNRQRALEEGLTVSTDSSTASAPDGKSNRANSKKLKNKKAMTDVGTNLFGDRQGEA